MRKNREYGYVRVSSKEQNEARQMEAMHELGIPEKNIFVDKQSGMDFDRPQYQSLKNRLREGDTVYILSIDRLGRDYVEIMEQWKTLTKVKKANIVVLDMPLLDTRERANDLTEIFVSEIVLQILSYVAQNERENIRKRQAQGIKAALSRGVRFGRPKKEVPENFMEIVLRYRNREITKEQALEESGMTHTRFYNTIRNMKI